MTDQEIINNFRIKSNARILDIGGSMKQREGFKVDTLVDILRPEEVSYTPSKLLAKNFVRLDITKEELPFSDKEFDFCLCSHILEDLSYPFLVLEEMGRVAKRGLIITPSFGSDLTFSHINFTDWLVGPRRLPGAAHHKWLFYKKGGVMRIVPKNYPVLYSGVSHVVKWMGEDEFIYYWERSIKYHKVEDINIHSLIDEYEDFLEKNRKRIKKGIVLLYLDNPLLYLREFIKLLLRKGSGFSYRRRPKP